MRPDLGRRLAANAAAALAAHKGDYDVVFVVADGLSARAVVLHARPVLSQAIMALRAEGWRIAPLVIVCHGRVAIGDAIATALGAASVAVLIGERPGLSAPDSMGAYLTFRPHAQTNDAERNCISNIRPQGSRLRPRRRQARLPVAGHARSPSVGPTAQGRVGSASDIKRLIWLWNCRKWGIGIIFKSASPTRAPPFKLPAHVLIRKQRQEPAREPCPRP